MNKAFKVNKLKVWRKTYGKPFIRKRAFCIAQMVVTTAQSIAQIKTIGCAYGDLAQKAIATTTAAIEFSKVIADKSNEMNKGFV